LLIVNFVWQKQNPFTGRNKGVARSPPGSQPAATREWKMSHCDNQPTC